MTGPRRLRVPVRALVSSVQTCGGFCSGLLPRRRLWSAPSPGDRLAAQLGLLAWVTGWICGLRGSFLRDLRAGVRPGLLLA